MPHSTRRSAIVQYQRCPRSRYWLYEYEGKGLEPIRQAVPLATGSATHIGLAALLEGNSYQQAVDAATGWYDAACAKRGLSVDELEDYSTVYREQRALIEANVLLGYYRIIPAILADYEVLEVERPGVVPFTEGVELAYRPDALIRHKEDGDLYIVSWKTCATYTKLTAAQADTDMQQISEVWAREHDTTSPLRGVDKIRGTLMIYIIKGRLIEDTTPHIVEEDGSARTYRRLDNPLLYGYRADGFPPTYAANSKWVCSAPHPMRRSRWYPTGECAGLGRRHKRGDEWKAFATFSDMGTSKWIEMLSTDTVLQGRQTLDQQWVMPVPLYRNTERMEAWRLQATTQEAHVAHVSDGVLVAGGLDVGFPQYAHTCNSYYGRKCPCYDICWGPSHIAAEPLDSQLYQLRGPDDTYKPEDDDTI